jgi:hypothetical protein
MTDAASPDTTRQENIIFDLVNDFMRLTDATTLPQPSASLSAQCHAARGAIAGAALLVLDLNPIVDSASILAQDSVLPTARFAEQIIISTVLLTVANGDARGGVELDRVAWAIENFAASFTNNAFAGLAGPIARNNKDMLTYIQAAQHDPAISDLANMSYPEIEVNFTQQYLQAAEQDALQLQATQNQPATPENTAQRLNHNAWRLENRGMLKAAVLLSQDVSAAILPEALCAASDARPSKRVEAQNIIDLVLDVAEGIHGLSRPLPVVPLASIIQLGSQDVDPRVQWIAEQNAQRLARLQTPPAPQPPDNQGRNPPPRLGPQNG